MFNTKQEHFNYFAQDENLGPLILSVKHETIGGEDALRVVLRSKAGTIHDVLAVSTLGDSPIPARIAKVCVTQLFKFDVKITSQLGSIVLWSVSTLDLKSYLTLYLTLSGSLT